MRVISGTARGKKLKMVPGVSTRPVMDRVKESFFNIIGDQVVDSRWLDLFAGTGQVGIEALSRGAAEVIFIDNARAAIRTVHTNLEATRLSDHATVLHQDAFVYLRQLSTGGLPPFDFIYIAPPQYKGLWLDVMNQIDRRPAAYLTANGVAVAQIDPQEFKGESFQNLELIDRRKYGRTLLCFFSPLQLDSSS